MTASRVRINFTAIAELARLADYTIPFAIRAVSRLGVADHLADGPRSIESLAAATGAHAPSLLRALRALVARGVFREPGPGWFELTALSDLLRTDHPLSMRAAFRTRPDVEALCHLEYTCRSGEPAFERCFGASYFEYLAAHPDRLAEFHASQQALSRLEALVVLRALPWAGMGTVVDLGGGDGTFLAHLLARHHDLGGILFDLPDTTAAAPAIFAQHGVTDRCEIVAGDLLKGPLPAGADAYLIKRVLVGMDDAEVSQVLRAIRAAMAPQSRVIVLEPMATGGAEGNVSHEMDLLMLVLGRGRVRTPQEYQALLASTGLQSVGTVITPIISLVQAAPGAARAAAADGPVHGAGEFMAHPSGGRPSVPA